MLPETDDPNELSKCRYSPDERMPPVWLWKVNLHLPGGLPMGQAGDLDTAKADFKVAWKALKARTPSEQLAAAYKAMNIRDDG